MQTAWGAEAQLALDTVHGRPTKGIPTWLINPMEWRMIDRLAGLPEGTYQRDPIPTYHRMQERVGTCFIDQWIPENPLTMGSAGFEGTRKGATTGAEETLCDGILIDSPEAVAQHLEQVEFPRLQAAAQSFDEEARFKEILAREAATQELLGPNLLKTGHGFVAFPSFSYSRYGYAPYFMAFALYPEMIERHFSLQSDLAVRNNRAAARAYHEGHLPPLYRLDHDMADSRGTLVRTEWLDRLWFPHFARSLEPLLATDVKLLWHCDGNLSQMVPRLIEVGLRGFQGFQYEDGMDYEQICRLKTRDGDDLFIIAGVSVTRTLPLGTPAEVKSEMAWLVEHGPRTGLALGASSSITPGVPWENLRTLVEGFAYYREHGRGPF
ncbi:hypothetical protein LLH03_12680 [bacterium]|nr:hypothetical protein [bacterium]